MVMRWQAPLLPADQSGLLRPAWRHRASLLAGKAPWIPQFIAMVLATEGSSRSFTYSCPSVGCGTGKAYPGNPSGTCTG